MATFILTDQSHEITNREMLIHNEYIWHLIVELRNYAFSIQAIIQTFSLRPKVLSFKF